MEWIFAVRNQTQVRNIGIFLCIKDANVTAKPKVTQWVSWDCAIIVFVKWSVDEGGSEYEHTSQGNEEQDWDHHSGPFAANANLHSREIHVVPGNSIHRPHVP